MRRGAYAVALGISCVFIFGIGAGAFKTFNNVGPWGVVHVGGTIHQNISSTALMSLGISEASFQIIDDGNTGQDDVTHYNFTQAPFHHFDDNTLRQSMAYVKAQREEAVRYAAHASDDPNARRDALETFGELIHTAQDFYSHMNYVELALKADPSLRPAEIPIVDWNHRPTGVRSGYFFFKGYSNNEMTASRDSAIQGLHEEGVHGNFLSAVSFAERRRTFEDVLAYATDGTIAVLHADLNKDGPTEPEGRVVVPATGITLHAYAVDLAVRETVRQWQELEAAIRRAYPRNAAAIMRALKGQDSYEPRRVDVIVKDKENGAPIVGARVILGEVSSTTNAEGRGILRSPPGTFPLTVSAEDYESEGPVLYEVTEERDAGAAGDGRERTVFLVPAKSDIRITVKDSRSGLPVSGAEVTFHNEERAQGITLTGTSGRDGRIALRAVRGHWSVWTTANSYRRDERTFDIGRAREYALEILLDAQPVPVTVVVVASEGGRPIRNATVTLDGAARSTDAAGEAFFPVPHGSHTATATASGRRSGSVSFTALVGVGRRETIQLPAAEADITVRVVAGNGERRRNVEGADVSAEGVSATTGADGRCRLRLLPGAHTVSAEKADVGSGSGEFTVTSDGGEFVIALVPSWGEIAVTILDDVTARPVSGARVSVGGATAVSGAGRAVLRIDEDGEFEGSVEHGDYLNGSFHVRARRGRTAEATVRLVPARCVDAGDREACNRTLGGMCPCQRHGACGMPACLYQRPPDDRPVVADTHPLSGSPCSSASDKARCDDNADNCPCGRYGQCGRPGCRQRTDRPSGTSRTPHGTPCRSDVDRGRCDVNANNCPCGNYGDCGRSGCRKPTASSGNSGGANLPGFPTIPGLSGVSGSPSATGSGVCSNIIEQALCMTNPRNCPCSNYGDCRMPTCRDAATTGSGATAHGNPCANNDDRARCDVNANNCPCGNYGDCGRSSCRSPGGAGTNTPTAGPNPGRLVIASPTNGATTRQAVITVTGTVENRAVTVISLNANGSPRNVAVSNGQWTTQVPLIRGRNTLVASAGGVTSNAVSVTAEIARSAVWTELTWGGAADIDLHLYLPNGEHCYYSNKSASGAVLDVDNTTANGPEHITMENAIPGEYRLTVLYFGAKSSPAPSISWRVTIRLNDGAQQQTYSGVLSTEKQERTVATWRN